MRTERWEWIAFAAIVAIYVGFKLPTLMPQALALGWYSDSATFGLMAKRLLDHGEVPIFFWGQSYMGPLTSYAAAFVGLFRIEPSVGPLTLRITTLLLILGGLIGYWRGLRRAFGGGVAALACLWTAIGPGHLFLAMYAPIGSEQLFFLSGILFAHAMRGFPRSRDWFVFGLLSGIGWWIHQGIVFVAGATLIVVAWNRGMRLPPLPPNRTVRAVHFVLLFWIAVNVLGSIAGTPLLFLHRALLEPVGAYAIFRLLFARSLLAMIDWRNVALAASGALLGYAPVLLGWWLGAFEWIYEFSVPPRELTDVPGQLRLITRHDFWSFIGAERWPWSIGVGAGIVALLLALVIRRRQGDEAPSLVRHLPAAICAAALAFYIGSARATPGTVRYVVPALPILYAFAAEGARRLWMTRAKAVAPIGILTVTFGLALSRVDHIRDLLAARAEYWVADFPTWDPRPALAAIKRGGYTVCASDYFSAYKLEFILEERVRFIVRRSYDRRPERSHMLAALPVRKCLVDTATGRVTDYDPKADEGEIMTAARKRSGRH